MLGYLPNYYETSRVVQDLLQVEGAEFDDLKKAVDEVLDQFFVETATWGLDLWEKELGIVPVAGQPEEQRRSIIKSKLRGMGTVTIQLMKTVAEAYDGGKVDVTQDAAAYTFTVTFVDTKGIPPNLDELKKVIEEIKPAHLHVEYVFTYLNFGELEGAGTTFEDLELSGMTFDELSVWSL